MYMIAKHLHLTAVVLTFIFFVLRFVLLMMQSPALQKKWLKVLPHIFDTLLIITIVWLCVQLSIYPIVNGWASAKLTGLVCYILSMFLALRWAKSNLWRIVGAVSTVFWFVMTLRLGLAGPGMFA